MENSPLPQAKKDNFILETIKFIVLALIIVGPIRLFIAQPFIVSGASMDPAFHDGQYLIVDQVSYRVGSPARNDVIVFRPPVAPKSYYIKRIIGLPGETVEIRGNEVIIKNKETPEGFKLPQPYVFADNQKIDNLTITLGPEQYFVMGDNRLASSDSRTWGPVSEDNIVGKPFMRLFPLQKFSFYPG
jgi:signal peptidase I